MIEGGRHPAWVLLSASFAGPKKQEEHWCDQAVAEEVDAASGEIVAWEGDVEEVAEEASLAKSLWMDDIVAAWVVGCHGAKMVYRGLSSTSGCWLVVLEVN